jgi:hypothetical protein
MTRESNIEALRRKLEEAGSKTLGDEMHAYMELCAHPELTWNDLLNGLSLPQFLSEDAALRLYQRLEVHREGLAVNVERLFWETILQERGINPVDRCGAFPLMKRGGWSATA